MKKEPVTLVAVVQVLIALAVAFGLDLNAEQTTAILAAAAVVGALIARNFTWSEASVEKVVGDINYAKAELKAKQ